ncbi:MAG: hypothetical protein H8D22_08490 [Candidatus Cloacimonetes bacterium]|nr:hypothetical protein [Candidatus Cloacimonadota bacterium]
MIIFLDKGAVAVAVAVAGAVAVAVAVAGAGAEHEKIRSKNVRWFYEFESLQNVL